MGDVNPFFVSKRSKRGVFIFIIISLLVVFTPRILFSLKQEETYFVSSEKIKEIKRSAFKSNYERKKFKSNYKKKNRFKIPPAKFNPNIYTLEEWMHLGLSNKQAAVVLKFTKRGIYSNEQLKKIVFIPDQLFNLIKDSTIYPDKMDFTADTKKESKIFSRIELNGANEEKLEEIPGIGAFFAKNILKHRDRLGGFLRKEQLLEIWKFDIEKLNSIEQYIEVDSEKIRRIELNTISVEELKDHPYLNWSSANSIIKIRAQKGRFKSIEEIKESVLIDEEMFEKLKPYLTL
jgi:DNA uptake protein ComE-like DNA-binding protein